ncbi:elongation factor G-binding protein [Bacillus sp. SB49]|uniref:FusB/FusC family EF-G-binding protein n=1 Tax=Bacillus sp. SB49 TaxID=1071080 RepID=UPI0004126C54|nr:elongation factor G-binding protein [Bacillus sp. SB49]QHT47003.1 elongation factor G-binding protein [Bacillus sp. SB49]
MKKFIRPDQYHFIQSCAHHLYKNNLISNDAAVTNALKEMTHEKVLEAFQSLTLPQKQIIDQIKNVQDETDAILYFSRIKQYVNPLADITEETIQLLFPKTKKLTIPDLNKLEWTELSYIGWNDYGKAKKFIVTTIDDRLVGLSGHFSSSAKHGICSICHEQGNVGLLTSVVSRQTNGEMVSRGNYICVDSQTCNKNLKSRDHLENFMKRMKS